jgi:hypothetical protein
VVAGVNTPPHLLRTAQAWLDKPVEMIDGRPNCRSRLIDRRQLDAIVVAESREELLRVLAQKPAADSQPRA